MAKDRPEWNGRRIQKPGQPNDVWVIDQGRRRFIPDQKTYGMLFRSREGIREYSHVDDITEGDAISDASALVRVKDDPRVYLFDPGVKRWIISERAFNKWWFNWNQNSELTDTQTIKDFYDIPDGPNIE